MVDCGIMNLNLSGREVTLEVRHIVHRIPQTELYIRKNREFFQHITVIGKRQLIDLTVLANRYESGQLSLQSVLTTLKCRISHSMMALIRIEISLRWHPARIPDRISFFNIVVMSVAVIWNIVVTISRKTKQLRIFIEAVTSTGIGDQRKEILGAQIVDPWKRGLWRCDDVFFVCIIEISKFHMKLLLILFNM